MKIISIIKERPFRYSLFILLGAFIFSRAPFFLWMGLPEVNPDTFDYFNVTDIIWHYPISELGKQPIELPLGYPLFLLLTSAICNKLIFVVALQSLLKLGACIYMAYTCCKHYKHYGLLVALGLGIYLMNGFTIRYDNAISTESLYSSSLIILSAILIEAINRDSHKWYWLLGFWLFLPGFIRPNGMYVYFIIGALFIYFLVKNQAVLKYAAILTPVLVLNLAWSAFNIQAFGRFIPGNFVRFSHVLSQQKEDTEAQATNPNKILNKPTRLYNLKVYFTIPDYPQYYYSLWETTYKNMYVYHQVQDSLYKMYDWTTPIPDRLRRFGYKEFYTAPDRYSHTYTHLKEHSGIRGLWLTAYHVWYKIEGLLIRNLLWFIMFTGLYLFSIYKLLRHGFKNPFYLLLTLFGSLHMLSVLVVTYTHPAAQVRYTHVSEFIIYVIFALSPLLMTKYNPRQNAE